jgi:positive regulator of sigma E activity
MQYTATVVAESDTIQVYTVYMTSDLSMTEQYQVYMMDKSLVQSRFQLYQMGMMHMMIVQMLSYMFHSDTLRISIVLAMH